MDRPTVPERPPDPWVGVGAGQRAALPDSVRDDARATCDSGEASVLHYADYIIFVNHYMVQVVMQRFVGGSRLRLRVKRADRVGYYELFGADTVDDLHAFLAEYLARQTANGSADPRMDHTMFSIVERDTHTVVVENVDGSILDRYCLARPWIKWFTAYSTPT